MNEASIEGVEVHFLNKWLNKGSSKINLIFGKYGIYGINAIFEGPEPSNGNTSSPWFTYDHFYLVSDFFAG